MADRADAPSPVRARELAASAAFAVRLTWQADRRGVVHLVALNLLTAAGLAGVIVVLRGLLGDVLSDAHGGGPPDGHDAGAVADRPEALVPAVAVLVTVGALAGVAQLVGGARQRLLTSRVDRHVIALVLRCAAEAELPRFEDPAFHDRLQRAVFASRSEPAMVVTTLVALCQAVLTAAAVAAAFLVMAWWLLPFALLAALPALRAARDERDARYRLHRELAENRRLRDYLEHLLTGRQPAREVRALALGGPLLRRWDAAYRREIDGLATVVRTHLRRRVAARLAGDALTVLVVLGVWALVRAGLVSLSAAAAGLLALWLLAHRTQLVAGMLHNAGESVLYLRDLRTFTMAADPRRTPPTGRQRPMAASGPSPAGAATDGAPPGGVRAGTSTEGVPVAGARAGTPVSGAARSALPPPPPAPPVFRDLRAEEVTFTYPGARTPAVRQVSVALGEGEVVALVGANGSGKTTLAALLAGLYPPDSGVLRLNGEVVTDPRRLRAVSAVVFQEFTRYRLPALDNITFGRPETPPDLPRAVRAADRAGAHAFLERLPAAYDTPLSTEFQGGRDLSGGQWQRLALARAHYRDAPLVLLDEPTAALDPEAEADLFARIRRLFAGRSVLVISHRVARVRHADRIYVMDGGRVSEAGTHQTLLRRQGTYARFLRLQAPALGKASATSGP